MSPLCHAILDWLNTYVIFSGTSREKQRVHITVCSILGLQDYRTLRNEFPMSLKSPRASKRMWLGIWLAVGSASGVENSGLLTQEQSHLVPFRGERDWDSGSIHRESGLMSGQASCRGQEPPWRCRINHPDISWPDHLPRVHVDLQSLLSLTCLFSCLEAKQTYVRWNWKPGADLTASCCCRADRLGGRRGAVSKCVLGRSWVSSRKPWAYWATEMLRFVQTIWDGKSIRHKEMPCILDGRKSSRLGPGVILLGWSTRRARTKREVPWSFWGRCRKTRDKSWCT